MTMKKIMMMKKNLILIIAFVVVAALAFYGGMKYGSPQTAQQSGQFGQFRNSSGTGSGRSGGSFASGSVPLSGQIISKDSSSLTLQLRGGNSSGSTRIVLFSGSTSITKSASGTVNDLSQGEGVTVIGKANPDGSVTADSIQIRPVGPRQIPNQ